MSNEHVSKVWGHPVCVGNHCTRASNSLASISTAGCALMQSFAAPLSEIAWLRVQAEPPGLRRAQLRRLQQDQAKGGEAEEELPQPSEEEIEEAAKQAAYDAKLWEREPLAESCAALVLLGEADGYGGFEELLTTSRLSSSLRAVQDALHLPVCHPPPSPPPPPPPPPAHPILQPSHGAAYRLQHSIRRRRVSSQALRTIIIPRHDSARCGHVMLSPHRLEHCTPCSRMQTHMWHS